MSTPAAPTPAPAEIDTYGLEAVLEAAKDKPTRKPAPARPARKPRAAKPKAPAPAPAQARDYAAPFTAYVDKAPTAKQAEFTAWLVEALGVNPASLSGDEAFELAARCTVVLYGRWQAENRTRGGAA